ncbi:MAG: conjugal transfer protein TraO [Chryseobacterium culicis]
MLKLLYITILLLMSKTLEAQRMIPGQKGIEINFGFLKKEISDHYFFNLEYIYYSQKGNYGIFGFEYGINSIRYSAIKVPVEDYTVDAGYSFNLMADHKKRVMLNATLSAVGGYENINNGGRILYDGAEVLNESSFIYGGGGRISLETYLSDHLVVVFSGRAKYLLGTSLDRIRPSMGMGLRFNF